MNLLAPSLAACFVAVLAFANSLLRMRQERLDDLSQKQAQNLADRILAAEMRLDGKIDRGASLLLQRVQDLEKRVEPLTLKAGFSK